MATVAVPMLVGSSRWSQRTVLDGAEYVLDFAYNQREDRWYLAISDANGALLVGGIKLVVNWPLLYRYRSAPTRPPGELQLIDARAVPSDPGLDDLAGMSLLYTEAGA